MLEKRVYELINEDEHQKEFPNNFELYIKNQKKYLQSQIQKLQLETIQNTVISDFNVDKLNNFNERIFHDLQISRKEFEDIYSMLFNLKIHKESISDQEKKKLISNFYNSLEFNQNQWKMIIEVLKKLFDQMKIIILKKSLQKYKSQKLNLSFYSEIKRLQKMVSQEPLLQLSMKSKINREPLLNFNNLSSCYSQSQQSLSDISRQFSPLNHSWLFKNSFSDNTNQNSQSLNKYSGLDEFKVLREKQQILKIQENSLDNSDPCFLIPNEEKLKKIMDVDIQILKEKKIRSYKKEKKSVKMKQS